MSKSRLLDNMLHLPAFKVNVEVSCGLVRAPIQNDGMSVFMTTPFNLARLDSDAHVWAGNDGSFVIGEQSFAMDSETPIFHGPNIRLGICMDGQVSSDSKDKIVEDKLDTQNVIYGNSSMSLAQIMLSGDGRLENGFSVDAGSSDEKGYMFKLRITPHNVRTQKHYSDANIAHIRRISAQHISMTTISQALESCRLLRQGAFVEYMGTRGVPAVDANTFYMCLPMGSIYDIRTDHNSKTQSTVDLAQWSAIHDKSAKALAASHVPKLVEATFKFFARHCGAAGIDFEDPAAVRVYLCAKQRSPEGLAHIEQDMQRCVQLANEDGFKYTSDSEIKGFEILNTMDGIKLKAQFASSGEKQNGHGLDALTCANQMRRVCTLYAARVGREHAAAIDKLEHEGTTNRHSPLTHASALLEINEDYARKMSRSNIALSMHQFRADCEDACASLVGVMHAASNIEPQPMAQLINRIVLSGVYPPSSHKMAGAVNQLVNIIHTHKLMSSVTRSLCFAHGANLAEMKNTVSAPIKEGVLANYRSLIDDINARKLTGHATASIIEKTTSTPVHPLIVETDIVAFKPLEGTNPVDIVSGDRNCRFDTHSNLAELDKKFESINGVMPLSFAKCIVSELSTHSAKNVLGCDASAVTYTTSKSSFYHTLIATSAGYVYSERGGEVRPTSRIALLDNSNTRSFVVEGQLLDKVCIAAEDGQNVAYTEDQLLDIVVQASTCLAPTPDDILQRQLGAGLQMASLGRSVPPSGHEYMTRIICRTPVLQVAGVKTNKQHGEEELARISKAKEIHPDAETTCCNSHTFNIFIPKD